MAPVAGPELKGESVQRRRVIGTGKTFSLAAPKMEAKQKDINIRLRFPASAAWRTTESKSGRTTTIPALPKGSTASTTAC